MLQLDMSLKVVVVCSEGLARLSRRVWRRFVRGSREISLALSDTLNPELAKENVSHLGQLKSERHAFLDAANLCVQRLAVGSLPLANNVLVLKQMAFHISTATDGLRATPRRMRAGC